MIHEHEKSTRAGAFLFWPEPDYFGAPGVP